MHVRTIVTTAALGVASTLTAFAGAAPGVSAEPARLLDRNVSGAAAVSALGDELDTVARRYDKTATELSRLLRSDPSLWVDPTGMLHVKEPRPSRPASAAPASAPEAGPFPNTQTFALHSQLGAERTLFLDFDGGPVSGTAWNDSYGVPTTAQPAFDLDGNPGAWSQAEHDVIQSVWQRVAEDFRPFRVDVTTQDPGAAALNRSSAADTEFGSRVLITPSVDAATRICSNACGGVAFIGTYDVVGSSYYDPAWVFAHQMGGVAKYIAEAASHEAGHNLGLFHDGTSTQAYYAGHHNWAPIMGVGYYEPLVQWSRGEYADANNTEDDFVVMQGHGAPLRTDDHGSTPATATALGTTRRAVGYVERRGDKDVFSFRRTCGGSTTITASAFESSPNLDIRLRLLNAGSAGLGASDPTSGEAGFDTATGLSAGITRSLAPGTYYAEVDGTGVFTAATGYTDYGSLGRFTLRISPC